MFDIRARLISYVAGVVLLFGPLATAAHAVTFGFSNISNNTGIAGLVGAQLSVDVTAQSGTVRFTFNNSGPIASSITDIYFDDPTPLAFSGISSIVASSGVSFSAGASPPNLPGGNTVSPAFNATFAADSNTPGVDVNGVNPGEWVAIILALTNGATFSSVVNELIAGTLRIGIHVQAINDGKSDAYIATTPIPAALPLFVTGLVAMGLLRRRQKKSNLVAA